MFSDYNVFKVIRKNIGSTKQTFFKLSKVIDTKATFYKSTEFACYHWLELVIYHMPMRIQDLKFLYKMPSETNGIDLAVVIARLYYAHSIDIKFILARLNNDVNMIRNYEEHLKSQL